MYSTSRIFLFGQASGMMAKYRAMKVQTSGIGGTVVSEIQNLNHTV
jgi:hypothetical protein